MQISVHSPLTIQTSPWRERTFSDYVMDFLYFGTPTIGEAICLPLSVFHIRILRAAGSRPYFTHRVAWLTTPKSVALTAPLIRGAMSGCELAPTPNGANLEDSN